MHGTLPEGSAPSISPAPTSGIDRVPEVGPNPESGTSDWFYDCCVAVFGKIEIGQQLHLATGWPRTNCYAMVARDPEQRRKPNPEFLRVLFHSDHGGPFHDAFMAGCNASWWRDRERNARLAAAAERFAREIC
jgi:hypothetical protein